MKLQEQISKRRTFGIISHPDAGKTTLTEKLLLFGGAIKTAGAVKSNKIRKTTTSDFMEIEKQRGISVATSVMGFEYNDFKINILDTPGHKDFAEDTYRTLTAVDSVILVVDSVKGVEEQTRKLMEVCRMRNTPVIVFINKLDRDGQEAFTLLDEIERELNIHVRPLTWPVGAGRTFKGIYNLFESKMLLYSSGNDNKNDEIIPIDGPDDPELPLYIGESETEKLKEDAQLIDGVYEAYDEVLYKEGLLAPVFFGSAINNFGVQALLDTFVRISHEPRPRVTDKREINPYENKFTGFIFKIHANLDPNHRDRIAFCRIVSGRFERNKFYYHTRLEKKLRFSNPTSFMANDKTVVEEAFPGDVIGLYDTGNFKIGDTLSEGEILQFKGIPNFSPEIFKQLINTDPFKSKQLEKGTRQLTDEGLAQLFIQDYGNTIIIGTVGELQFDVIRFRLLNEYGASCEFRSLNYYKACWITSDNTKKLDEFISRYNRHVAYDKDNKPVYMAESAWVLKNRQETFPEIEFHFTSEFKTDQKEIQNASAWG